MGQDNRIRRMQRRIDQLSVEPWINGPELEQTYRHMVQRYAAQNPDDLDLDDARYLLDATEYLDDTGTVRDVLEQYADAPSIGGKLAASIGDDQASWEEMRDRFDQAMDAYDTYIGVDAAREPWARTVIGYGLEQVEE